MKTCWRTAPEFRIVGKTLKHMFRDAILVNQSNSGNAESVMRFHRPTKLKRPNAYSTAPRTTNRFVRHPAQNALFYYQKSPTFCERDPLADVHGTADRKCHRNASGIGSCTSMCCGRGYSIIKEHRVQKCLCKFRWCCEVECKSCRSEEWTSVCN